MSIASKLTARVLIVVAGLPLTAIADSRAPTNGGASGMSVIVMRGIQVQGPPVRNENGVIVMRPTPGSFMRETTRLAAEAEARNEWAAREEARDTTARLAGALSAVESAANAVARQPRRNHYLILAPTVIRRASEHGKETSRLPAILPPT
jgi:hypothetical protein